MKKTTLFIFERQNHCFSFGMKYDAYSLTELIRNDDFIAWVLHPDAESDIQWNIFLAKHPEKKSTVESAREYVILLAKDTGRDTPAPQQSEKMWKMVEESMHEESREIEVVPLVSKWRWIRVAASAAIILSVGSVSYWFYYKGESSLKDFSFSGITADQEKGLVQEANDTDKPMMVLLPDGSSVVLEPGASLSFIRNARRSRREVTLSGKAFFEIAKDSQRPFLVYSQGLATKVLGTSFLIDASDEDIEVEVKTGVVTVFSVKNLSEKSKQRLIEDPAKYGVMLKHDERIAFSNENGEIVKLTDVENNVEKAAESNLGMFVFDETPVEQVFKQLESAYNVKIVYDQASWSNFPLNATLTGRPFISKLEVICNALDAGYTIDQNVVTISANQYK